MVFSCAGDMPKECVEMKYLYKGYNPPSNMFSPYIDIGDIDLRHIDMDEFHRRIHNEAERKIKATSLANSKLVEATAFLVSM